MAGCELYSSCCGRMTYCPKPGLHLFTRCKCSRNFNTFRSCRITLCRRVTKFLKNGNLFESNRFWSLVFDTCIWQKHADLGVCLLSIGAVEGQNQDFYSKVYVRLFSLLQHRHILVSAQFLTTINLSAGGASVDIVTMHKAWKGAVVIFPGKTNFLFITETRPTLGFWPHFPPNTTSHLTVTGHFFFHR